MPCFKACCLGWQATFLSISPVPRGNPVAVSNNLERKPTGSCIVYKTDIYNYPFPTYTSYSLEIPTTPKPSRPLQVAKWLLSPWWIPTASGILTPLHTPLIQGCLCQKAAALPPRQLKGRSSPPCGTAITSQARQILLTRMI